MSSTLDAIADRFLAAYNHAEIEAVAALYSEDGWHGDAATGHRKTGRDEIAGGLRYFLSALPDAQWRETGRINAEKGLVLLYAFEGHLERRLGSFDGFGQLIKFDGAFLMTPSTSGNLASTLDYWNPQVFARQAMLDAERT